MNDILHNNGVTTSYLTLVLRLEGLSVLLAALMAYYYFGFSAKSFAVWFFVPDLSFAGYLLSSKVGCIFYNIMHSYILPIILAVIFWYFSHDNYFYLFIIWFAHIGFDRFLGYGLKYVTGFRYTHLGVIGVSSKNN